MIIISLSIGYYLVIFLPKSKQESIKREQIKINQQLYQKALLECEEFEKTLPFELMIETRDKRPICIKNNLSEWGYNPNDIFSSLSR